jgi:mono/diheme cytochrome c family protein
LIAEGKAVRFHAMRARARLHEGFGRHLRVALVGCILARAASAQTAPGLYSDQQAVVGEAWFRGYCVECHGPADMANDVFKSKWHGRTAFDLFERLRTSMPDGAAGSLPRQTYADLVAYFLKLNGRPAGPSPLSADSVALVRARLELLPSSLAK